VSPPTHWEARDAGFEEQERGAGLFKQKQEEEGGGGGRRERRRRRRREKARERACVMKRHRNG